MKQRKRVTKRSGKRVRITRLMASAEPPGSKPKSKGSRGAPPSAEWIARYREYYKPRKQQVTLRLDADVLAWFKKKGRGYQSRINGVLRARMMREARSE